MFRPQHLLAPIALVTGELGRGLAADGVEARLELCWLDYGGEVRFTALFPPLSPLPKGGEIWSPPPLGEDEGGGKQAKTICQHI